MEIAFTDAGNFEVLQRAGEGEEVPGVVAVGLGRDGFPGRSSIPLLLHEGLQELLYYGLNPLLRFL